MPFPILKTAFAAAVAMCAAGLVPAPARADMASLTLKSTSVELPDSSRALPPGPGVDMVAANCTGCHSLGMILNQPSLSRTAWEGEVKKMIGLYKAPVEKADVPAIVAYLAAVKGP